MSSFLKKVEVFAKKEKTMNKPTDAEEPIDYMRKGLIAPFKPRKPTPAKKVKKTTDKVKSGPATAKQNPKQTSYLHLRKQITFIEQKLQKADPFALPSPGWGKFFFEAGPEIIVALLWDLGHLTENKDRTLMLRYLRQRIKNA